MYVIDKTNIKKMRGFYSIFLGIGILISVIFIIIICSIVAVKMKLDSSIKATNIEWVSNQNSDGGITYNGIYSYRIRGEYYTCNTSISSNFKSTNELVYYNSKNPSQCQTGADSSNIWFILLFLILPTVFLLIGGIGISNINKKLKKLTILEKRGKLVKNIPYTMVPTGTSVNGVALMAISLNYQFESGKTLTITGDARFDRVSGDADGMVDLLIDPMDETNYFVDFNIDTK